jgi:hypothetical protein
MTMMFRDATGFDRDLSSWCVSQFASEPQGFADGAVSWNSPKPAWGTCP